MDHKCNTSNLTPTYLFDTLRLGKIIKRLSPFGKAKVARAHDNAPCPACGGGTNGTLTPPTAAVPQIHVDDLADSAPGHSNNPKSQTLPSRMRRSDSDFGAAVHSFIKLFYLSRHIHI